MKARTDSGKTAITVSPYQPEQRDAVVAQMARLQDFERALSTDRTEGELMARAHFDYLLGLCRAQEGRVFVALDGAEVIGFAVVFVESEDPEDKHLLPGFKRYGWLSDLYVQPGHRGRGAASLLMRQAERHCVERGVRRLKLSALQGNEVARDFYAGAGYSAYEVVFSKDL